MRDGGGSWRKVNGGVFPYQDTVFWPLREDAPESGAPGSGADAAPRGG